MITLNSTILSYNKINQVQEQIPIPSPDSYIFEEKKSAQKLIPDLYDLDRLDDGNICTQRKSTPNLSSKNVLRKNYFNSVLMDKSILNNYNTNKVPVKVVQPNIYSNYDDDELESMKNSKEIKLEKKINFNNIKNPEINNVYQNEVNKINDDIINNININKNIIIKSKKKDEYQHSQSGVFNQNLNLDINSTNNNISNINNNNDEKIKNKKTNQFGEKSIRSAFAPLSFKNIMKKDPNKNIITINTSLYKPKKRRTTVFSIKNSINDKSKNSINDYLKFEEESNKDQNSLNNIINIDNTDNNKRNNKINLKEEVLKSFRNNNSNSNSIFNLSNNSHLEQEESSNNLSKLKNNDMISDIESYLNMEENNGINKNNIININNNNVNQNNINLFNKVAINPTKKNNLNNYNFKTERNSIQQRNSKPIINNSSSRFSSLSSRKYNFDCPKKIILEELSKDHEDNKNKNFGNKNYNHNSTYSNVPLVKINIKGLKKIIKKDGFFNILTFLDDTDLISLLKTNKSLIGLINKSIANAYFFRIKQHLRKFRSIFELLKCSLIYTELKNSFKIDFVINIRFINQNKINNNINTGELTPKCYQLLFFYQCFKPTEPNAKLKTKETTKRIKMYDYYTFDLYPDGYNLPSIYINKESQQLQEKNLEEKLVYIQPILPFKFNDKGIINFEIYSSKNYFINPSSIKVIMKRFDLKNYINELNINNYNNLRVCEYEDISTHWKLIDNEKNQNLFMNLKRNIKARFEHNFLIESISFINIGFFLFKINLEAKKPGVIDRVKFGNDFGITLIIKKKYENVENEIKKNNLIIERRQIYELRVGDKIVIYISAKRNKSPRKK